MYSIFSECKGTPNNEAWQYHKYCKCTNKRLVSPYQDEGTR